MKKKILCVSSLGLKLVSTDCQHANHVSQPRSFSVAGPRLWSVLPIEIKTATDINVFKKLLKTFLFMDLTFS